MCFVLHAQNEASLGNVPEKYIYSQILSEHICSYCLYYGRPCLLSVYSLMVKPVMS